MQAEQLEEGGVFESDAGVFESSEHAEAHRAVVGPSDVVFQGPPPTNATKAKREQASDSPKTPGSIYSGLKGSVPFPETPSANQNKYVYDPDGIGRTGSGAGLARINSLRGGSVPTQTKMGFGRTPSGLARLGSGSETQTRAKKVRPYRASSALANLSDAEKRTGSALGNLARRLSVNSPAHEVIVDDTRAADFLMTAVKKGDLGELNNLLMSGANPRDYANTGDTPLHMAALMGDLDAVSVILVRSAACLCAQAMSGAETVYGRVRM